MENGKAYCLLPTAFCLLPSPSAFWLTPDFTRLKARLYSNHSSICIVLSIVDRYLARGSTMVLCKQTWRGGRLRVDEKGEQS
jgi:hypothetical protein